MIGGPRWGSAEKSGFRYRSHMEHVRFYKAGEETLVIFELLELIILDLTRLRIKLAGQ